MNHAPTWILGICLLLVSTLTACGGSGGGGVGVVGFDAETLVVPSHPDVDGVVDVSGFLAFRPAECFSYTGDLEASYRPGYYARQLFAFSLGGLPHGARILSAELRLYQASVEGSPYEKDGDVIVDHVNYVGDPGPETYDGQTLTRWVGTLSTDPTLEVKTLQFGDCLRADWAAGREWSQYRLRFHSDVIVPIIDHVNDYVRFTDGEGGAGGPGPVLVITSQDS